MPGSFFAEMKRRNVFRVAAIYIVVGWVLMQIGDIMFPALRLPEWSTTLLVAFLILGLPVALILAWAFELTPDGVVRTADVPVQESITTMTGQKINYMIIAALALAVVVLLARDLLGPNEVPEPDLRVTDRSIAVLPFKNRSASEENAEFFSGGLHDELLTLLSRVGDLKVISRTSVEQIDPALSIPEIGTLLGVATVLEGQVQRAGNRLRINVQLIDAANEDHLWANIYDSELTAENVFEVQGDIARTIATALQAELSPEDEQVLDAVGTEDFEALEDYLRGVQIAKRSTFDALEEGAAYLVKATRRDPGFAQAWAQLALVYGDQAATGAITLDDYSSMAGEAVERALGLDPTLPTAYAALGTLRVWTGDWSAAEAPFEKALQLDPDNSMVRQQYALYLRSTGQPDAAIDVLQPALRTDPLSTELWFQLGKAQMFAGRPEETLQTAERIFELEPSSIRGIASNSQALLSMGRYAEAIEWMIKALESDPSDYESWAWAALIFDDVMQPEVADSYLRRAESLGPTEPMVLRAKAQLLLQHGDVAAAADVSQKAIDAGLDNRWDSAQVFHRILRDRALGGDVSEVLALYRDEWPGLFADPPAVDPNNWNIAADVLLALQQAGLEADAATLTTAALDWYAGHLPEIAFGVTYGISRPELYAVAGMREEALEDLRRAVDSGWRLNWEFFLLGPNFSSLRDEPRYQALVEEVRQDMAAQAEAVRTMPPMGEYDLRDN
jgi:TolB-like protein/Tfp pilus assembly protein PilF